SGSCGHICEEILKTEIFDQSEIIVKTVKEVCAEGLIVSGGEDGIFIKEVKPETPASKHLSVKEGDQILSATVYFDNVSYEDALQILEHAQPYKVAFCLKRKPTPRTQEDSETMRPDTTIVKSPRIKEQKVEKIINISKAEKKQSRGEAEEFNVEDVKEAVSKFPAFKLPERDITGVLVQREITFMEMKTDKTGMTPKGSPCKIQSMSTEINIKLPDTMDKEKQRLSPVATKDKDVTVQESDITEVVLDSEKRTSETDPETDKNWSKLKMPTIDVSVPKIKIPKAEGKSKQEETGFSKPQTEEGGMLPDASEKNIKVSRKSEVEQPELPKAEIKEAESKMKKRKISFPKFGFSKSDTKVSDADITLPATQGSLYDADGTEIDVESKTTDVEAEFKDSTDSPTKFKLPTLKLPKFGVSFPKSTDVGADIQMPDVRTEVTTMDVKLPETKLSVESTALSDKKGPEMTLSVSKPEVDLSLPEGKIEIKGFQKKEIKSSEEIQFSKPDIDGSLTDHDAGEITATSFSKQDIKAAGVDVSLPQVDLSIPEGSVETREPGVNFTISKDEAEHKDLTSGSTPVKFKLPSLSLPKFGGKSSKVVKDMPVVDIDIEEPDVSLPEKQISLKLKDDAPSGDVKDLFETTEGQFDSVDVKVKEPKLKEQEVTVTLPKFEESMIDPKESNTESVPAEKDPRSPTKFKLPTIKFPKFGVSFPKSADAISDSQMPEVTKDEPTMEIKVPETELSAELPSLPEMKTPHIILSISKPEVDVSTPEADKAIDTHSEKVLSPVHTFSKPEVKISLVGHDEVILEAKEMESEFKLKKRKIYFPKFGFSKSDTKIPDVDTSLQKEGISVPDTEIKETEVTLPAPEVEVQLKNKSTSGSPSKFKLPTISLPKFDISISKTGEESTKKAEDDAESEIKVASAVASQDKDAGIQDTEPSKSAFETLPVDAEIKTKDTDPGSQGSRFMMPKFEFSFPRLKGPEFKKGASRTDVEKPEVSLKHDKESAEGTANMPGTSAEFGFSKPKLKAPEVDVSIQKTGIPIPEGSMDLEETNVDIKFKLPSISLPKFGVKSPKVASGINATDPELEGTNLKTDISKPDVKLEVQPPNTEAKVEGSADMPEVDSKGLQVKVKRPSFSFPKFGFSKPDTSTPEVNVSAPKAEVSIQEVNVPVKVQTAEITLSGGEAEQKDLTIVSSPTKFKLPEMNLPKFGVKTSKGTVSLPSADKDIKVSGQIPKIYLDVKEIETDIHATIRETDVHLAEGKIILPQPNVDIQDISIEGKADMREVDLKGLDVKLNKPSFSFPKFGFSKPDIKGQDVDASQPKVDMSMQEGNIPIKDLDAEITITDEVKQGDTTKFKFPSINLPKFGLKHPKATADIPAVEVDIKEPEISLPEKVELQSTDTETNIDIKGPSVDVDIKVKEIDADGMGSKFKLPKFAIVPEVSVPDKKFDMSGEVLSVEMKGPTVEGPSIEINIKGDNKEQQDGKFKPPKFGIALPTIKGPDGDQGLKKALT
uniref:PDZ domain-containing protein n=1 Tax=Cyprinus carpio TaxID=7962 RepID=A0A8C1TBF6_CYPCA